ncbi:MAG: hypothetical protein MUC29_08690 [Pyrinomonadaceae bacterium]|nr:hypothetical protein [Pyrinomonadaceae bacterium]
MKYILVLLICVVFALNINAQNILKSNDVAVEEIYFAKDDGEGKVGEISEKFTVKDIPIHCIIQLNSTKATTVKMIFVAVNVKGVKPETKIITTSYTTNGKQNKVRFSGTPEKIWFVGTYRVDIFLDGKLTQSKELEIEKSAIETTQINTFQPTAKPKPAKKPRKN